MNKKFFYSCFSLWFILVNLPQFFKGLNRIEPIVLGLPFNMLWIWSLNLIITVIIIIYIASRKVPKFDFESIRSTVAKEGLEVEDE